MIDLHTGPILRSLARNKARSVLTLSMTVLTFAVVVNSILLIRAQQEELRIESGFDDEHLIYLQLSNFDPTITTKEQVTDRIKKDLEILRRTLGVISATSTRFQPWRGGGSSGTAVRFGDGNRQRVRTQIYSAGPELPQTLGIDTIVGRTLSADDLDNAESGEDPERPVGVVVSRRFADELYPNQAPLGKLFTFGERYTLRIDGIIERFYNPYAWNIEEKVVFYAGYTGTLAFSSFLLRVDDQRLRSLAGIEEALLDDSPQRGINLSTIPETRIQLQATERMTASVLTVVIGLMVFITAVSIIGLTAASVASRRREIGTRRALGATRRQVLTHFLLENAFLTLGGIGIGIFAAYALNVALVDSLGVPQLTIPWVVIPAVLVTAVNVLAAWQPAARASRIAPAVATKAA